MLTEHFIASVGVPTKVKTAHSSNKDVAVCLYEYQPLVAQRTVYKKSITEQNCLALSNDHVFTAQGDKAVVHVYNRSKGSQEAIVPFTERITSIALACDDTVLVLGTVEGRIFLWETCTGRQISTTQAHLQPVTVVAVDATSNTLLSASKDSTIHVWSIPDLLSFSRIDEASPLQTFSSHREDVVALALGHGAFRCNFAVSVSSDRTCHVWDYRSNVLLRTYLLPSVARSVTLDPADRAIYVGYEDGSLQQLDLFANANGKIDTVHNRGSTAQAIQPPAKSFWKLQDAQHGAALSLGVSFDGATLVSGHASGSILIWDVAKGSVASTQSVLPLPGPVTNLLLLPITGYKTTESKKNTIREIVKPKFGAFGGGENGAIPTNYTLNIQLHDLNSNTDVAKNDISFYESALYAPSVPASLLEKGLAELSSWGKGKVVDTNGHADRAEDYMALDAPSQSHVELSLEDENRQLKLQIESLRRVQRKTFSKMDELNEERNALLKREQKRLVRQSKLQESGMTASNNDDIDSNSD